MLEESPVSRSRGFVRVAVLTAAAAIVVSACSGGASPSTGEGKVALLLPESKTTRYEAADKPFFEAKFKEVCPNTEIIYSNANDDAALQQQQAEAAIANGAKVLVLDPRDGEAAGVIVKDATSKGIKVISYDRLIKGGSKPDYYISFDNERVGKLQGEVLAAKLKADGNATGPVVMINGSSTDNNALLFNKGAKAALDAAGVTIAKEDWSDWDATKAQQLMEGFIAALGKDGFKGLYAANDNTSGGAQAAMKAAGIDVTKIPSTGQDAEVAGVQRILAGEQFMTVYKAIQPQAEAAAELACQLVKGETPTVTTVPVNNETADIASILLDPIAVTKDGALEGTKSVKDTIVADKFYGADTVAQICTADYAAACTEAGIQ